MGNQPTASPKKIDKHSTIPEFQQQQPKSREGAPGREQINDKLAKHRRKIEELRQKMSDRREMLLTKKLEQPGLTDAEQQRLRDLEIKKLEIASKKYDQGKLKISESNDLVNSKISENTLEKRQAMLEELREMREKMRELRRLERMEKTKESNQNPSTTNMRKEKLLSDIKEKLENFKK